MKDQVSSFLRGSVRPLMPRICRRYNGGFKVRDYSLIDLVLGGESFYESDYEGSLIRAVRSTIGFGDQVVVVGGGKGVTALNAYRESGREVKVFEAGRDRAEEIRENAELNSTEVDVSHAVVGQLKNVFGRIGNPDKVNVEDLPRGDVLVLDCEGAEKKILQSLPEDSFDRVVVETHSRFDSPREEVVRILEETGFEVENVLVDEYSPERSIIVSRRSEGVFTGKDLENRLGDIGEEVKVK